MLWCGHIINYMIGQVYNPKDMVNIGYYLNTTKSNKKWIVFLFLGKGRVYINISNYLFRTIMPDDINSNQYNKL